MPKKFSIYFKRGWPLLLLLLELMKPPYFVTGIVALIVVAYYSVGIWHWAGLFNYGNGNKSIRKKEDLKLKRKKEDLKLKLFLTGMFVAVCVLVFVYYHQLIPRPYDESQSLIDRYRRALKIEKGSSTTTLIELSNKELKQKGTLLYKKIREVNSFHEKRLEELKNKNDSNGISEEGRRVEDEYNNEIKTDAMMVLDELKNRIPYEQRKHMLGLPEINPADPKAGSVTMYRAPWPGPFNLIFSQMMANEIEELVKLLPER